MTKTELYPLALLGVNECSNVFINFGRIWFAQDHPFNDSSPTSVTTCSFPAAGFSVTVGYNNTHWDKVYGARYYILTLSDLPNAFRWAAGICVPFVAPVTGEAVTRNSWRISQPNVAAIGPNPPTIGNVPFTKADPPTFVSTVGVIGKTGVSSPVTGSSAPSGFQVTCESWWGDCGSPYLCSRGIVGTHVAMNTRNYNLGHAYVLETKATPSAPASKLSPHSPAFVPKTAPSTHVINPKILPVVPAPVQPAIAPTRGRRSRNSKKSLQRSWRDIYNEASCYQLQQGIPDRYRPFCQSYRPIDVTGKPITAAPRAPAVARSKSSAREAALTDVSAPGSDYLGPRKDPGGSIIQRYIQMVTNPWSGAMVRLPDINITPTCLAKFYANRTFSIPNAPSDYYVTFGINSRLGLYSLKPPIDIASVAPAAPISAVAAVYDYAPGTILAPQFVTPTGTLSPLSSYPSAPTTAGPWSDDFGLEQTTTTSWISSYRTLAMAVRVRIVGLPTGTFMAPGKIYFAQVRNDATDLPMTEQDYVVLERLGRATHVSMDAVRESGSKTFFAVPDSADKMNLSSAFFQAPGMFSTGLSVPQDGFRRFPGYATAAVTGERMIMPYDSVTDRLSTSTASNVDAAVADQTMHIMCAVFGAQNEEGIVGYTLEVDYALVAEYIPSSLAPPGLETVVQLPSSTALDSIFAACAVATEVRPVLLQAPGDLTISSPTPSNTPAQAERARGVQRRLGAFTERVAGTAVPHGRREGWFDWLGDVDVNIGGWHLGNAAARADKKKGKKT